MSDDAAGAVASSNEPNAPNEPNEPNEPNAPSAPLDKELPEIILDLPYIPEFLLDEVVFWFVPSREAPKAAYHELIGESAKNWQAYYTKKGWSFIHGEGVLERDGPYKVADRGVQLEILPAGKFFAPKPQVRLSAGGDPIPLVSLEKHKPINPWKPNYVQALNFIKKYDWKHDLPRKVVLAMYEIEECGQVAGSTSWVNGERLLLENDSEALRATLADFFFNRPEDFELGSQVYLRVLGKLGDDGFAKLLEQASHPITRKRRHVARVLGELKDRRGVETLILLVDDEDFAVRDEALQALTKIGVDSTTDPKGQIAAFLEADEVKHRVWAAAILLQGGDESQRKFLVQLVKEEERPLSDMGELGNVILNLELFDTVPFLIKRFKSGLDDIAIDAAEILAQVTGLEFDYSMVDDPEQKRATVRTLDRWWEDHKRARSQQRSGGQHRGGGKKKGRG